MRFSDRLLQAAVDKQSFVVVGLDPRAEMLPENLWQASLEKAQDYPGAVMMAFTEFNRRIIDAVRDCAVAVKPQFAFYERYGIAGLTVLMETMRYARQAGLLVIGDAKRNDIGSTARAYARAYLGADPQGRLDKGEGETGDQWDMDAITVNAYPGQDGVKPFIELADANRKGIFVLVRTSNPSAGQFQDIVDRDTGRKVYEILALEVHKWGKGIAGKWGYSDIGAVVGATYPEEGAGLRELMPKAVFLVPGYGAQGGSAGDVVPCFDENGLGAVVNSSRGIIYAYTRDPWCYRLPQERFAEACLGAARRMQDDINTALGAASKLPF